MSGTAHRPSARLGGLSGAWLCCATLVAAADGPASVWRVDAIEGQASFQPGASPERPAEPLMPGSVLAVGRVEVAEGSRLYLRVGSDSRLQLGPGAMLIERLPQADGDGDRTSQLRIDNAELRLAWNQPGATGDWPLTLRFGPWATALDNGGYVFRSDPGGAIVCTALGRLVVSDTTPNGGAPPETLEADSCTQFRVGEAPLTVFPDPAGTLPETAQDLPLTGPLTDPAAVTGAVPPGSGSELSSGMSPGLSPAGAADARAFPASATPAAATPAAAPASLDFVGPPPPAGPGGTAPPPPPPGPEWVVNILSTNDLASAEGHATRLIAAGFAALVRSETVRGRASYRVLVAGIDSEAAANGIARSLAERHGYRTAWVLQKR